MPRLPEEEPQTKEIYLCVVSEWQGGRNSGNCYPVFVLTKKKSLKDPESEFPNAGAIFLPSRTGKAHDFVVVRPILNRTYADRDYRDCYFVPQVNSVHPADRTELAGVHSILTVPFFDPDRKSISSPLQMVTPVFFVRDQARENRLLGPLRRVEVRRAPVGEALETIFWRAESADGMAWAFPASSLALNEMRLEVYSHPHPEMNEVLRRPHEFVVGNIGSRIEGGEPVDLADEESLIRFFLGTARLELSDETISALAEIPTRPGTELPAYLRSRYDRLRRLLRTARELEKERGRIAREFLETEEGRREVHAEIAKAKAEARAEARAEMDVETEKKRLQAELSAIEEQKTAVENEIASLKERHEHEAASLKEAIDELKTSVALSTKELRRRIFEDIPAITAFTSAREGQEPASGVKENAKEAGSAPPDIEIRPLPPARPFRRVDDESLYVRWLRDELSVMGLHFSQEMVANIFTCLKCSSLTLIGGPPGVGKSSLVRALPVLMGQEHCFLELSVRRTWADDRAILGFPDIFHRRYETGTTGFVPHLVRAAMDLDAGQDGIYMVLLDEFNLAPPEYYFSEFLRILQKTQEDMRLRLYTGAHSTERDPVPPEIPIGPNISFWGTVNLDETTEPLSPRLLDRVQFVILNAEDIERPPEAVGAAAPARAAPLGPYAYRQLAESRTRSQTASPEARQVVDRALAILVDERQDWGAASMLYPRQLREIERYLAASRPVLSATAAADLVVNQRVLPSLRGRGDAFRHRIEFLRDFLASASLRRSASRLDRILRHASDNYEAFDFNVY